MSLLDHFHPPLSKQRHWQNLHSAWANALRDQLNQGLLPPRYVAEVNISLGGQIEVDLGTFQVTEEPGPPEAVAVVPAWSPGEPSRSVVLEATAQDLFEVQVFNDEEGPRLVAAVELLSPANKDRPAKRHAFAVKCASYLYQGIGLVMVDVVTSRLDNMHGQLLNLLKVAIEPEEAAPGSLYAAAYRPCPNQNEGQLDFWFENLALGAPLPTLRLWIAPDQYVPLPLDQAYQSACTSSRIAG